MSASSRPWQRIAALLFGVAFALAGVVVWLLMSRGAGSEDATLQGAIDRLVEDSLGIYDSHSDRDVGRILQPRLRDRDFKGQPVRTNIFGLREGPWELPKPEGTVRVVLLGDSFVFGSGVDEHERFGARLREFLSERAQGFDGPIECLHIGIPSWNIVNEANFLRRQLSELLPDLVVQVSVPNDVDDSGGARGYGATASFSPAHPERGSSMLRQTFPRGTLRIPVQNWINAAFDYESRSRYEEAGRSISQLKRAVEAVGGEYLLFMNWGETLPAAASFWRPAAGDDALVLLPRKDFMDERWRIAKGDPHWNAAGHERVARLLFGAIERRDLLPTLDLTSWPEAVAEFEEVHGEGVAWSRRLGPWHDEMMKKLPIPTSLSFSNLSRESAACVHGGFYREGWLSPYASLVLRCEDAATLRVTGSFPERAEMEGAEIEVFVEELRVGVMRFESGGSFDQRFSVPEALHMREFATVRFESSDYFYGVVQAQRCYVAQVELVAFLP